MNGFLFAPPLKLVFVKFNLFVFGRGGEGGGLAFTLALVQEAVVN